MSDGFSDVTLEWREQKYTVPADRVFELVRILENTLMNNGSVPAFVLLLQNKVSQSTLSLAYSQALRFAGAEISASDVYLDIMHGFANDAGAAAIKVQNAVVGLLCIISPPMAAELMGGVDEKK
jgi:hypothetical protein